MFLETIRNNLRVARTTSTNAEHGMMEVVPWLCMPSKPSLLSPRMAKRYIADI